MAGSKKPDFHMTDKAIAKVKELREKMKGGEYLRVGVAGGGCSGFSYHMNFTDSVSLLEDNIFTFDGLKVAIDQKSMRFLDGVRLDYVDGFSGGGLKFDNPNAGQSCGCGESFSPKNDGPDS